MFEFFCFPLPILVNKYEYTSNNKLSRETAAKQKRLQPLLRNVCRGGAEETWNVG